ncbi:hypothetical protein K458DRAFT_394706 [Lentithecium fluviatile CBS 122367]|uniref:F-box domain-containing protein n=1 Tax=Lentithecium fluviatile CBS 122367 TaxID=1168545 RepID=A0A6G1IK84_9PLEO|nr:hypothetical protein K458DRAFT_394706 [Lentithecium fluviatile CBS 122367]
MTAIERLQTPPPALELANEQLLTPPPTSGLGKRVRFADNSESPTSKRLATSEKRDESAFAAYTEVQDYSDEDSQDIIVLDFSSEKSDGSSTPTTPSSSFLTSPLDKKDSFAALAIAIDAPTVTEPFPFMKLPLSVRNRVYEFLLVVPALICVRQKYTTYHNEKSAYLYAEHRELLPGIAYTLTQLTVAGFKLRFARFRSTNVGILRASKQVHKEAKAIMYGFNVFEIMCPCSEISPPPNFKIHLFQPGYQRLVRKLNIRVRAFYPLHWLICGGYAELKDAYRGLETLTLIFELETVEKGFGKRAVRNEGETWVAYVKRLHELLTVQLYGRVGVGKNMPAWIDFRVLFDGDRYDDAAELEHVDTAAITTAGAGDATRTTNSERVEDALRVSMKRGLAEAFELFKK